MPVASIESIWGTLVLLGCLSGFLSGLLGVGGGFILIPTLIFSFPYLGVVGPDAVKIAMATSLALIIPTSIASVQAHAVKGGVDWRLLCLFGPSIVAGASVASAFAHGIRTPFLTGMFVLFALYTAWGTMHEPRAAATRAPSSSKQPGLIRITVTGLIGGAFSSLLGVGVAFFSVPMLARFVPVQRAIGTAAALCLPMAIAGVIGYLLSKTPAECRWGCAGYIYLPAVAAIGISAVLAAPMGARLTHVLPVMFLRRLFGLFLIAAAADLALKTLPVVSGVRASQQIIARLLAPAREAMPVAADAPTWLSNSREEIRLALAAHYGPRRSFLAMPKPPKARLLSASSVFLNLAPEPYPQHQASVAKPAPQDDVEAETIRTFIPMPERDLHKTRSAPTAVRQRAKQATSHAGKPPIATATQARSTACQSGDVSGHGPRQKRASAQADCPASQPAPAEPQPAEFNPFAVFTAPGSGGKASLWSE